MTAFDEMEGFHDAPFTTDQLCIQNIEHLLEAKELHWGMDNAWPIGDTSPHMWNEAAPKSRTSQSRLACDADNAFSAVKAKTPAATCNLASGGEEEKGNVGGDSNTLTSEQHACHATPQGPRGEETRHEERGESESSGRTPEPEEIQHEGSSHGCEAVLERSALEGDPEAEEDGETPEPLLHCSSSNSGNQQSRREVWQSQRINGECSFKCQSPLVFRTPC
jgi:hypothetical protein